MQEIHKTIFTRFHGNGIGFMFRRISTDTSTGTTPKCRTSQDDFVTESQMTVLIDLTSYSPIGESSENDENYVKYFQIACLKQNTHMYNVSMK